jgi:nucleoside-diphosphate-sugar epimerase
MRRVLVTGAGGRLGRAVVAELQAQDIATTGLVLSTSDNCGADTVVVGDARDVAALAKALVGVDAVIHLAAIPSPELGTAEAVFGGNTLATFTVLDQAARRGVTRSAIASSFSVTGLPFAPRPLVPAYLPIDEDLPLQIEDAYALSKQADEATAAMMWRRYGLSVVALRFPFLGEPTDRLPTRAALLARVPEAGTIDMWSYLDTRDAARACLAGITVAPTGCHIVGLAAPQTLCPFPTEALLDRYLPEVPRRRSLPGRTVPIDLSRAEQLLGFVARSPFDIKEAALP